MVTSIAKERSLLLAWFSVIFFSGFVLANSVLICASFIPLFVYIVGLFIGSTRAELTRTGLPSFAKLDEIIDVKITGRATGGLGAVVVYDEVAEPFQLVEGSNYKVFRNEARRNTFGFSYKIRCAKCGNYVMGLSWETRHIFGLASEEVSAAKQIKQLRIFPELPRINRIRLPVHRTPRFQPGGSIAKIGPLSTDFKDIRDYSYGDPFKFINWKASARVAGRGKHGLLVNEYEREGRQAIWVFLDYSPNLKIGTSVENVLQYGIRFAYIASHLFISKGYSLGMYVYNHQGETFHSDYGKEQFLRIANGLLKLASLRVGLQVFWDEGFLQAVERNRSYLVTQSPRIIIVTHVTPSNLDDLLGGLRRILSCRRRKELPNVVVINIIPYSIIPPFNDWEQMVAKMLRKVSIASSDRLRGLGFTVFDWDPEEDSLETILLNAVRSR